MRWRTSATGEFLRWLCGLALFAGVAGASGQSIDELLDRAAQQQAAGQLQDSAALLADLHQRATTPLQRAAVHLAMANQSTMVHDWTGAQEKIALAAAEGLTDPAFVAALESARGNLILAHNQAAVDAIAPLTRAVSAARQSNDALLIAQTTTNLARAAKVAGAANSAACWSDAADAVAAVGQSPEQANLQISLATSTDNARAAHELLSAAYVTAQKLNVPRIESQAMGRMAALYHANGQFDESLQCARRATFTAQQMPDLLYRWQWQTARTLEARGQRDEAIEAYRQASQALAPIRATVAIGFGNQVAPLDRGVSLFKAAVGDLYLELADLLLRRAAENGDSQADLNDARDALEDLKAAELEDYFQTDCATLVRADLSKIEELIEPTTAVVYVVPLRDRTELLLGLKQDDQPVTRRFRSSATREQLFAPEAPGREAGCVVQFRRHLEDRTSHEYRLSGKRVYDALIAPLEPTLAQHKIDTLVFVPDDALRTVPMAAVWDGNDFLIARYAIAAVPGLRLMRSGAGWENLSVLAAGLATRSELSDSGGTVVFPELRAVGDEVAALQGQFGAQTLMNQQLTASTLCSKLDEGRFGIVHLATHGEFKDDSAETFLLLGGDDPPGALFGGRPGGALERDRKLSLEELNSLILPNQFRGAPVQLLTLSACRSAAGDDRAALGLGGIALKAGARSAVATLWYVNDKVSANLISEFYSGLKLNSAEGAGLAKSLQQAQLKIARDKQDRRYRHPCYWSAYLLIGMWK